MEANFSIRIVPITYQTSSFSLPPCVVSGVEAIESIDNYVITNPHIFREYVSR